MKHKSIQKTVQPDIRFTSFTDWVNFIKSQVAKPTNTKLS